MNLVRELVLGEQTSQRGGFQLVSSKDQDRSMMENDDDDELMDEETGTEDDFRERVAWQSKYETSTCFGCGCTFNPITNRHHHCRACGRVVCGACSEHKDKVKGYAKPQRTCDECHERLANEVDVWKTLSLLCPCFKVVRRELRKAQKAQLLTEGAVFVRKPSSLKSISKSIGSRLTGFMSGSAGADGSPQERYSSSRVRVSLKSDGLTLAVRSVSTDDEEELIYLHDVRTIEAQGLKGLALLDSTGDAIFEGDLPDSKTRDAWQVALDLAVKQAKSKPRPPKVDRPTGRVAFAARKARKEIELQSKKRDADKKKAEYLKSVGGGLKYTAIAMADRTSSMT